MRRLAICFTGILLASSQLWAQNYYYVCSYTKPEWGTNILFSKVDLDSKSVIFSKEIPITGEICFKTPVQIMDQGSAYFFLATVYGLPGHNTPAGTPFGLFALVTEDGGISLIDSLPNTHFLRAVDTLENTIEFVDSLGIIETASLSVNGDGKVVFDKIGENVFQHAVYPTVGGFRFFKRIDPINDRVFWNVADAGLYLLLIDERKKILLDSLNISSSEKYSNLFALSESDSTACVFYIDCQCKDWRNPGETESIAPSYVKRYSTYDLSPMDSVAIANPSIDSICIGSGLGACNKFGDYRVYFFMATEHIELFYPAYIFIFDTRTNEATWLRVGWR